MKRKIAIILILALISVIPNVKAEEDLIYSESYENFTTNDIPGEYEFSAGNVHVTERVMGKEKAVEMTSLDGSLTINRDFEVSGDEFTVQFDMAILDNSADGEIIFRTGAKSIPVLNIENSVLETHDGRKIDTIGKRYKTITISFDKNELRYSVAVDKKERISGWYMANLPTEISGMQLNLISTGNEEFSFGFDNLLAAKKYGYIEYGNKPEYNDEYIDFVSDNAAEEESSTPIINTNFENGYGITGVSVNKTYNLVEIQKEDDGNSYVMFDIKTSEGCYIDMPMDYMPKNLVVEFDVRGDTSGVGGGLIARGEQGTFNWLAAINQNGTVTFGSGGGSAKLKKNKWTKIQMILNFRKHTVTAYADSKLICENANMSLITDDTVERLRFGAFYGSGKIEIDNLLVYQGKNIRTFEPKDPNERELIFESDDAAKDLLGENIAIHTGSGAIYQKKEKSFFDAKPFIEDGTAYIPVRAVCEAFDMEVEWQETEKKIILNNKYGLTVGETKVSNSEIVLEHSPRIEYNRTYLPLRDLCEKILNKKVYWNDRGIIIISDKTLKYDNKQIVSINNYLCYDRPDREEYDELYSKKMLNVHPRVMATQSDFDRVENLYKKGNPTVVEWVEKMKKAAETQIIQPKPERTSDPDRYALSVPQSEIIVIGNLALLYRLTGDERYIDKIWRDIETLCVEFEDWYHVEKYLAVGEMTGVIAIAYDWLYDYWTDEQRKIMENAIMEKSLEFADKTYYGQIGAWVNFPILENNWNFVCAGGTVLGAAAIYDTNPEFCSDVIVNSMRSVENVIKEYYPDGAWKEGLGYWQYATNYFVKMLSAIENMTGTDFNLSSAKGFSETGRYAVLSQGPNGSLGYHDGGRSITVPLCNMYLAGKFDDMGLGSDMVHSIKTYGTTPEALHLLWYREEFEDSEVTLPNDSFYDGASAVAVMREKWGDDEAAFLGYHIDKGVVDHGHIDSGSFIIDMWGEEFVGDLGPNDYTHPGYFTTERNKFYRVRPEGHNCLIINPDNEVGQQSSKDISIIKNVSKKNGAYSIADLTASYSDDVTDYKRGFMLNNDRRSVIVRDELELKKESQMYWFMHTKANIEIVDNNTAILTQNNKSVRVDFTTNAKDYELKVMEAKPLPTSPTPEKQNSNDGWQKLAIEICGNGKIYINVRIMRTDDPMYNEPVYDVNMDKWNIEEKDYIPIPKLSEITVDGKRIDGFREDLTLYEVDVKKGNELPAISAKTDSAAEITIQNANSVKDVTQITVTSKVDSRYKKIYTIKYNSVVTPDGMTKLTPVGITSSYPAQDGYLVENLIDGRNDTWWAAEGLGENAVIDYGEVKDISVIGIDMLYGTRRTTNYKLEISDDGENWKEIFNGANSIKTDDMEYHDVEGEKARYLKLSAYGNSEGSRWISLAEIEVWAK